jgi:hypothetical protein
MSQQLAETKPDKHALIGSCLRLPVSFDLAKLLGEFHTLADALWGTRGGRVGVHVQTEAVFLRGYAPAEGDLPIEDREVLASLPFTRALIYETFQAPPQRCLFAKLRANGEIRPHIDQGAYFERTVRIHFPVVTNPQAIMLADKQPFHMQVGEAWALNNSAVHGVVNKHPTEARTHLICDYLPTEHLRQLLRDARNRPSA